MHYSLLKCFLVIVLLVNAKIFAQASCLKSYRTQITEKGTTEVKNGTHEHVVIQFDKQNLCGIGTVEVQNGVVAQIQWIDDTGVLQAIKPSATPVAIQKAEVHIYSSDGQALTLLFTDSINP